MNKIVPFSPPPLSYVSKSGDSRYHCKSETNDADLPTGVFTYTVLARVPLLPLFMILCMTASYLIKE